MFGDKIDKCLEGKRFVRRAICIPCNVNLRPAVNTRAKTQSASIHWLMKSNAVYTIWVLCSQELEHSKYYLYVNQPLTVDT